jgi:hypothetical protein
MVDDKDMIDLVEEEIRELLTKQGFDGAGAPVIRGSALKGLEATSADDEWAKKILELTNALDTYIPVPERDTAKPFLMPVEDIFSIEGRGTVVTGKIERGVVKVGDRVGRVRRTGVRRQDRRPLAGLVVRQRHPAVPPGPLDGRDVLGRRGVRVRIPADREEGMNPAEIIQASASGAALLIVVGLFAWVLIRVGKKEL